MKRLCITLALLLGGAGIAGVGYLVMFDSRLRGGALDEAMQVVLEKHDVDAVTVARAILQNHRETRQIAALWSPLY